MRKRGYLGAAATVGQLVGPVRRPRRSPLSLVSVTIK
jgi:hypothetical protein